MRHHFGMSPAQLLWPNIVNKFTILRGDPAEWKSHTKCHVRRPLGMRFNGLALVAGAMAIVACSGGDKNAEQTAATTNDTAAAPATTTTATTAGSTAAMAPITGKTVEVKMIG